MSVDLCKGNINYCYKFVNENCKHSEIYKTFIWQNTAILCPRKPNLLQCKILQMQQTQFVPVEVFKNSGLYLIKYLS